MLPKVTSRDSRQVQKDKGPGERLSISYLQMVMAPTGPSHPSRIRILDHCRFRLAANVYAETGISFLE